MSVRVGPAAPARRDAAVAGATVVCHNAAAGRDAVVPRSAEPRGATRQDAARDAERGAILLLTLGYAIVALALVVLAVDVSAFFLARRSLAALADGAALAGTSARDDRRLYTAGPAGSVPLEEAGVRAAVLRYLADREAGVPGLQLRRVATDGRTVTVVLGQDKRLPFLPVVQAATGAFPGGTAPIVVTARARAPVTR